MTTERSPGRNVALGALVAVGLVAALAWGFAAYFRPDLLVGFATWARSCF